MTTFDQKIWLESFNFILTFGERFSARSEIVVELSKINLVSLNFNDVFTGHLNAIICNIFYLELIQKAHESGREKENTDWIYCARNIFAFFRERHHDLDLEQELTLVVSALNGRAMCHFHGKAPLFPTASNHQSIHKDLVIQVPNEPVSGHQMQAPRKFVPTSPYDDRHANTSSRNRSSHYVCLEI